MTPSALLVGNEGVPFEATRIESLLQLGDSSKDAGRRKHHTIGYKGIGFSAVLEVTDRPQIISQGVAFGLSREAATAEVARYLGAAPRSVPVRSYPFLLDRSDWAEDQADVDALLQAGAVTVIRLPFMDQRHARAA